MKKISEMSEDEVRDYALKLEEEKTARAEDLAQKDVQLQELRDLNTALQKRNNELFLKVEQQVTPTTDQQQEQEDQATVQSCEELGRELYKEINK